MAFVSQEIEEFKRLYLSLLHQILPQWNTLPFVDGGNLHRIKAAGRFHYKNVCIPKRAPDVLPLSITDLTNQDKEQWKSMFSLDLNLTLTSPVVRWSSKIVVNFFIQRKTDANFRSNDNNYQVFQDNHVKVKADLKSSCLISDKDMFSSSVYLT